MLERTGLHRVLIPLPSVRFGGTERHTLLLAAEMRRRGMEVAVAAEPELRDRLLRQGGEGGGVAVLPIEGIGWRHEDPPETNIARQGQATLTAIARMGAPRPDAAMLPLPWPNAGLGALRALRAAGLPRLVVAHLADPRAKAPPGLEEPPAAPEAGAADAAWVAVSEQIARRVERLFALPRGRARVVPNAPPISAPPRDEAMRAEARAWLRSQLGLPPEAPVVLFMGRLEEAKGADLLPRIAAKLDATIACAGDGPMRADLEDAAAALEAPWRLRLLGHVGNPSPLYLAADALLLPSRLEGYPLVFLEAAAHRCPVVATEAALEALGEAAPRLAALAPTDDTAALTAVLADVLIRPPGVETLVEAAARHAASLAWPGLAAEFCGLLRAATRLADQGR